MSSYLRVHAGTVFITGNGVRYRLKAAVFTDYLSGGERDLGFYPLFGRPWRIYSVSLSRYSLLSIINGFWLA
jgi:hypothetical protein